MAPIHPPRAILSDCRPRHSAGQPPNAANGRAAPGLLRRCDFPHFLICDFRHIFILRIEEVQMHAGSQQVLTVFGGAFVAEQHVAEADRSLAQYEAAAGVAWLWLAFYVV